MSPPLVSVVMVTRNVDRFLAESIESILGQTFREFEFIIGDFGSTDNSKSIASAYAAKDSRIKLNDMPDCRLAEARNRACALARGRYIAIMDADDVSVPDRLSWQFEFMERHPDVGIVGGDIEWISATGKPLRLNSHPAEDHDIKAALRDGYPFCHPSLLMRRDVFVRAGGYRAVFGQAEDYDLATRMSEYCKCANLNRVVLKYRIHPHQESVRKVAEQALSILAVQASASSREKGLPDPLNSINEITPEALVEAGIARARQQNRIASYAMHWSRTVCTAGEYSLALTNTLEMLRSQLKHARGWRVADLWLLVARLSWREHRFAMSCSSVARAFMAWPIIAVRPLKPLLGKLDSINPRKLNLSWRG